MQRPVLPVKSHRPARTVGFGKRDSARTVEFGKWDSARIVGFGKRACIFYGRTSFAGELKCRGQFSSPTLLLLHR
jgi:hypothetical protein